MGAQVCDIGSQGTAMGAAQSLLTFLWEVLQLMIVLKKSTI